MDAKAEGADVAPAALTRRQLAILAGDVVDYSRLTEAAESETHHRLRALRVGTVDPSIVSYRGQIIKNTGDGFFATFDSCVDAVRCAIEIQQDVGASESVQTPDRRIRFRMGLNLGNVIIERDDIYGTSVNVAARLEQFSPPGGLVISEAVREAVDTRIPFPLDDLGRMRLKNISQPVRAFSLQLPGLDKSVGITTRAAHRAKAPAIAVLPFRAAEDNPDDSYFGEGMVDDIIVALASIRGLLVISRTSALSYRSGPLDLQKIGQDLGVRYILSGSVRRSENHLRINSELADVQTNSLIWADSYDGEPGELFKLQERIATRIVWSVAPQIREVELKRALRKRPESMNAYDLVLQAINLIYSMNFVDFSQAGRLLVQAIAADKTYATAYAYAALWYIHNVMQGWTNDVEADRLEAARLATAAVDRDPADGFALAILGHAKAVLFREYDDAQACFDRALTATPGNAMAWTLSSGVHAYIGDGPGALERAERGLRLSPVDKQLFFYLSFLTLAHYVNGTYEEAIIWGRKSVNLNPRHCASLRLLAASLVALKRVQEARYVTQGLLRSQPRFSLQAYARWCPFKGEIGAEFVDRLRQIGLPD